MLPRLALRRHLPSLLSRRPPAAAGVQQLLPKNSYATAPVPKPETDAAAAEEADLEAEQARILQAPNRSVTWSGRQNPRELAMSGPRFEQTDMQAQPRPYAAIELIHEQPVRFVDKSMAVCDGGGGPAGHPKIFINVDKPEIVPCGYCGLPYAYSHHRKHLESLPSTEFPLS